MTHLFLTGGAGFIGHHTVEHILKNTDWTITIMDRLNYAGNQNRLTDMSIWEKEKKRVNFIFHDFRAAIDDDVLTMALKPRPDYIIHMGAESHVDRSISYPMEFATANVIGTINMLQFCADASPKLFIYVSTDEVYGALTDELHKEGEPHKPSNPYSASKAGAEDFCYAFHNSYKLPIVVSNTMNNFGERQNAEKFVPRVIRHVVKKEKVTLHCKKHDNGIVELSSRCWLHARNHADALLFLCEHGVPGEKYNVVGERRDVGQVAEMISEIMEMPIDVEYEDFHSFRPGHDMHYGLDGNKMREMGWVPPVDLLGSLTHTVRWTLKHPAWLGL